MATGINTIIYPVEDLARAKVLYRTLLGVEPYVDEVYYFGLRVGDQEIGLDPNGHAQGMAGATGFVQVEDIDASVGELVAAGAETLQGAKDVGEGKLIATIKDADGNTIGQMQNP